MTTDTHPMIEIDGHTYAAWASPGRSQRELIVVYRDGHPWDQRETTRVGRYDRVHLLGGFSDSTKLATEYSGRVRPVGSGGKYGIVRGSVPIQRREQGAATAAPEQTEEELLAMAADAAPQVEAVAQAAAADRRSRTTTVPEVPAAAPLADGELADLIRTKLASEERHTAELERLARIAAQTQAALIVEIQAAGQAGLTNRAISRASGLSHPTVAKILADPARYGGQTAS